VISWDELTHEQRVLLVNASEHDFLHGVMGDWRPAGAASHDERTARAGELVEVLLAMVDAGWIEVRRFARVDSDEYETLSREMLPGVLSDPAIWDWWWDSPEPALALVFTERGGQLWRTDWADTWHRRLTIT
jgi:hypothetical protein